MRDFWILAAGAVVIGLVALALMLKFSCLPAGQAVAAVVFSVVFVLAFFVLMEGHK